MQDLIYDTCPQCGGYLLMLNPGVNDACVCDTCDYELDESGNEVKHDDI